jgi:Protein of unknown function (DUF3443)
LKRQFFSTALALPFLLGVMCLLAVAGCGGSGSSTATTTTINNTAILTASSGLNGLSGGIVNGLYITVTVCQRGTATCKQIDNVQVDTGSIGLRIVPAALGSVTLTPINVNGSPLEECIQYGDTSYSWGPLELGDVQIAGEKALNIPVQLLGQVTAPPPSATQPTAGGVSCLQSTPSSSLPGTPPGNEDTVASLGSNGILGIGGFIFDCGNNCTTVAFTAGYPYYICPNGTCQAVGVPTADQAVNPVAQFTSTDNNGVMITLPTIASTGAVTVSGTMNFGIATRTDNALGNAKIYALDQCGNFPTVTFNGATYSDTQCTNNTGGMGGFLDTGSNALYVSDANTLKTFGISDCASGTAGFGFYCVSGGTATLSNINLIGFGGVGSANISLNINNATTLFSTNNAVFNDLGSDSVPGGSPAVDFWDLGMPFFLGRTVFVGIAGTAAPAGVNVPNGFVAF